MKLATLKNNTRDGQLVVVDKKLSLAVEVPEIAATMQQALDDWADCSPKLNAVYQQLNAGHITKTIPFTGPQCCSPLPRAYQWVDGSAYVSHVQLTRKSRGAEMPESFWTDPLMYQGGSDTFLGPCDAIELASEDYGIDFEGEVAVITTDVPMAVTPEQAEKYIVLLMLVNDVSLRQLIPAELAKGFGFLHGKPSSAFSPVAVTPDELGSAWSGGKVHLPIRVFRNDELFGEPNAGIDMTFNFPTLIAHAAKTRQLGAGTIVGSGTISNIDRSVGSACIIEKRMLETLANGKPTMPFLKFGERVRMEMLNADGESIFGRIDQDVSSSCK